VRDGRAIDGPFGDFDEAGLDEPMEWLVPAARVGRLAVTEDYKGCDLGAGLLVDAIGRAPRSDVAAFPIVVDAKDDRSVAFSKHHDLIAFTGAQRTLFKPLAQSARAIGLILPSWPAAGLWCRPRRLPER
jgi:hypothetical protein